MYRVLFASSEAHPLIKTGGLADVSGSLPQALSQLGHDVRLVLPAYGDVLAKAQELVPVASLTLPSGAVEIQETVLPGSDVKVWLVSHPFFSERYGNPYLGPENYPWHDNALRFGLFCRAIVEIACNRAQLDWQPQVVHCNDWQTGLVPALLEDEKNRPATVFTIHNLAYQGLFPHADFEAIGLPDQFWSFDALEFYGQLSFIKGGLVYADRITAVSPTYAKEIQTHEFGYGLEGLLQYRNKELFGILNGIDVDEWNPAKDSCIDFPYSVSRMSGKKKNKLALQKIFGLEREDETLLVGMVGRMVHQKGIDLVIDVIDDLMKLPIQLAILGTGEHQYEESLLKAARSHAGRMSVNIGYDEALAHKIEAGADVFLMPSRFEPCGLNQMYSLRYGTLPLVHAVGGLADTVVDASLENLKDGVANGITFEDDYSEDLKNAMHRAVYLYSRKKLWRQVQRTAMQVDHSWKKSAGQYLELYAGIT
jgi:starch synthase